MVKKMLNPFLGFHFLFLVLLGCGAKTVHSWANIGLASGDSERIIERISKSKHKKKERYC